MPTWRDVREIDNLRAIGNMRQLTSDAIQSQYSASPKILGLSDGFQRRIGPRPDIDLFYEKVFNIYTAQGVSLDNWGRIVGINRTIVDPDTGVSITLVDNYYRLLLLYKALANISSADAYTLNRLLTVLVQTEIGNLTSKTYVLEVDVMVIRYVFEAFFDETQLAIFKVAGTLAKGAGVGWELYAVNPEEVFGFDGGTWQPFNQAPFAPDNALIVNRS